MLYLKEEFTICMYNDFCDCTNFSVPHAPYIFGKIAAF